MSIIPIRMSRRQLALGLVAVALSFDFLTRPDHMTINASTGRIEWTPTAAQLGGQVVSVVVTDPAGAKATQTFTVLVKQNQALHRLAQRLRHAFN